MIDYINELIYTGIATVMGAFTWAVRTILTNKEEVRLLKEEITRREETRREENKSIREVLHKLDEKVDTLQRDILDIYKNVK